MPFLRRRAERLGNDGERLDTDAFFARLGFEEFAFDSDDVAEIEMLDDIEQLITENVLLRVNLDDARLVLDADKLTLTHVVSRHDAPGNGDLLALGELRVSLGDGTGALEVVVERVDAL